jgi:hypothetical protein
MRLELKDNPREWQKFILAGVVVLTGVGAVLWRRGAISFTFFAAVTIVLSAALVLGWLRPRWIRPLYRGAMTASFYVGQIMGRVLLTIVFVVVLTPLALMLRLFGKDLLRLKRDTSAQTYWRPGKIGDDFDRQF